MPVLLLEGNAYMAVAGSRFERLDLVGVRRKRLELTGYGAWERGAMVNITTDQAVGGTFMLGGDANGYRVALKGRYRRWSDRNSAMDLGAGIMGAGRSVAYTDREGNYHVPAVGLTADASIGYTEWASAGVRADVLFSEEGERVPPSRTTAACGWAPNQRWWRRRYRSYSARSPS